MKNIKQILTVIDNSELSRDILKRSIELADKFNAKIIILYTIHIPFFNLPTYQKNDMPVDKEKVKEHIEKIFNELNKEKNISYHTLVDFGNNSERAVIEAKRDDVDIIITGSGIKYEKVIREAQKPLLIIKTPYREYKDILIPTDLTERSKESIAFIKNSFDANLSLLYGYEKITGIMGMYDINPTEMITYQKENSEVASKLLHAFEKEVGIKGELTDTSFSLSDRLVEYIEEKKPNLVAVASHASEESFFVGSISSHLGKELSCDILIYC